MKKSFHTPFGTSTDKVSCYCLFIYATSIWLLQLIAKRELEREHNVVIEFDNTPYSIYRRACRIMNVDYHDNQE